MLVDLARQGFTVSSYTLVRLRFELGIKGRIWDPEKLREADVLVKELVREGIRTGAIEGYGKQYLFLYFCQLGMNIARNCVYQIYRHLNPAEVNQRN
jgi:hypothetical protein